MPEEHYLAPMIRTFLASDAGRQLMEEPDPRPPVVCVRKARKFTHNFIEKNKMIRPKSARVDTDFLFSRTVHARGVVSDLVETRRVRPTSTRPTPARPLPCNQGQVRGIISARKSGPSAQCRDEHGDDTQKSSSSARRPSQAPRTSITTYTPLLPAPRRVPLPTNLSQ